MTLRVYQKIIKNRKYFQHNKIKFFTQTFLWLKFLATNLKLVAAAIKFERFKLFINIFFSSSILFIAYKIRIN